MGDRTGKWPFLIFPLAGLHLFLGLSACAGGGMLMLRPDGSLLGMQAGWLDHSPFQNYLIPGIILFIFSGLFPLFTVYGLLFKPAWSKAGMLNLYGDWHWSWACSLYAGIILIAWITIQLVMTQYFWIQPVMIFTGLLILVFTLTPGVMNYYKTE